MINKPKKPWKKPVIEVQQFFPDEYVSACGMLEDGSVLYADGAVTSVQAFSRTPAGQAGYVLDDVLDNEHTVYMGSFFHDKAHQIPDATQNGHEEQENWGALECVRKDSKSPWGYHYHFISVTNQS